MTASGNRRPTRAEAIAQLTAPSERYELATEWIAGTPQRVFTQAPISLRAMYEAARSDAEFIVYEDQRFTFESAWRATAACAIRLVELGVAPGDRVAIAMRNYPDWMTSFAAITSIGAIAVAMNALWTSDEIEYALSDCGASVVIADDERADRITDTFSGVVLTRDATIRPGDAVVTMPEVDIRPDDPATMFYTSGSTGHPKGVVSTHRNVVSALLSWELEARITRVVSDHPPPRHDGQTAALLGIPLFHVTGSHAVFLVSYRAQRKLVAMYKWDVDLAAELIERERITAFLAPPALTGDLVRAARTTGRDLSSLLTVGGGGASRAPEQVAAIGSSFRKALPNTGWGMTETNAIGAGISEHDYLDRPASSGRAAAVLDLRIVDGNDQPLPPGERGELQVRGTSVFRGYWNRPDLDAEVFVDGWFRTGDIAYLDDEGYLFIVDRSKDLIIRGGENIGCGAVEAALTLHPDVHEAAVYSVPDERLGEEVGATVYAEPGLDVEDLRTFARQHLAAFEVPRYVLIQTEPLPRIATGKIAKRDLRAAAHRSLGLDT